MLSNRIKEVVKELNSLDKALLIEYLHELLNQDEDKEILNAWITESEDRLSAVESGELDLIDYSAIKKDIQ